MSFKKIFIMFGFIMMPLTIFSKQSAPHKSIHKLRHAQHSPVHHAKHSQSIHKPHHTKHQKQIKHPLAHHVKRAAQRAKSSTLHLTLKHPTQLYTFHQEEVRPVALFIKKTGTPLNREINMSGIKEAHFVKKIGDTIILF